MLPCSHRTTGPIAFGALIWPMLAAGFAGCNHSPAVAPVRGSVLLDEKPLASGAIVTLPQSGRGAQGAIRNGRFELSTYGTNDGALLGRHKIAVVATEPSRGTGPEAEAGKLLVPAHYTNPDTSGLTIDVERGVNNVELKLSAQPQQ